MLSRSKAFADPESCLLDEEAGFPMAPLHSTLCIRFPDTRAGSEASGAVTFLAVVLRRGCPVMFPVPTPNRLGQLYVREKYLLWFIARCGKRDDRRLACPIHASSPPREDPNPAGHFFCGTVSRRCQLHSTGTHSSSFEGDKFRDATSKALRCHSRPSPESASAFPLRSSK